MPSIYVVEPFWTGVKHARFNSAFLMVLENIFPGEQIHFYAESKQLQAVSEHLREERCDIQMTPISLPYQDKKYKIPLLYLTSLLQSVRALIRFPGNGILIFSGMNALVLAPLYLCNLLLRRRFIIVTHGELAFLDRRVLQKLNLHYRLQAFMFRTFFKRALASRKIYFIVLGGFIYRSLKVYVPERLLEKKTLIMEHPYLFTRVYDGEKERDRGRLHLAVVGLATRAKGADHIITLSRMLEKENCRERVQLSIIGKVVDFEDALTGTGIRYYSGSAFIPQAEYDRLIEAQDFILFFYPDDIYKLTASGAFMDCLLHDKPIMGIRNDFFSYYFEKVGAVGYLDETIEDMADRIKSVIESGASENASTGDNVASFQLEKMRKFFSPASIAGSLQRQLKEKKFIIKTVQSSSEA